MPAWACSTLAVAHLPLLASISAQAIRNRSQLQPQNRAGLAWAASTLRLEDVPLRNAIASAALPSIRSCDAMNIANPSWSFAKLEFRHRPLLDALAAESIARIAELAGQECSNIAWSMAHLPLPNEPLMDSIASQSLRRIGALPAAATADEAAVLLQCFWKQSLPHLVRLDSPFARASDPAECKVVWLWCAWARGAGGDLLMWQRLEASTQLRCISPLALRWWQPWGRLGRAAPVEGPGPGRYRKLLAVLKQLEHEVGRGCVPSFHAAAERFAMHSEGAWLKVAGGAKGEVLEGLARATAARHGASVAVELGTFIGYTAVRLAAALRGCRGVGALPRRARVATVESDPVHVAVARHFIDLVQVAAVVEVQPGMARDAAPLLVEEFGPSAAELVFMDQKGTAFHTDHALLDALGTRPPGAGVLSDNVLRPGAPVYAWVVSRALPPRAHMFWSLPEFLEESFGVEDWMALHVNT
mmetsp:Transcript_16696/g.47505  ORF Transcript_16696/g.47505 Transcript_16696/m.47505 type:complete len:472 (+) Transcript_16696:316-1731(+)